MSSETFETLYFKNRTLWRNWLEQNHATVNGIWFVYYKKHTNEESVTYIESVEEALCFGWIDSTKKRLDEERYVHKFTPRKKKSNWSELNKRIATKLIKEGKMSKPGLQKIKEAKQSGEWGRKEIKIEDYCFSDIVLSDFKSNIKAFRFFQELSPKQKAKYTAWIMSAKKKETQINRLKKLMVELEKGRKLTFRKIDSVCIYKKGISILLNSCHAC